MLSLLFVLAAPTYKALPEFHDWYGVYLQGKKVGYVESLRHKVSDHGQNLLVARQTMTAHVSGMGQDVSVEVVTENQYENANGKLARLSFKQTTSTGAVELLGEMKGKTLNVIFKAGGEQRPSTVALTESANDSYAGEILALDPKAKIGDKKVTHTYDASVQKVTEVDYELIKIEDRLLDGVNAKVRFVASKMPELNIDEEAVYGPDGRVLESKIGGIFTMRLEDEKRAKDVGYSQDVLISFVVPVDRPIDDPAKVSELDVRLVGAGHYDLPQTPRQHSTAQGDSLDVHVERVKFDPASAVQLPVDARQFKDTLKPENLIQSDAPEIRRLAHEIVGKEKNSYKAAQLILDWVYSHVENAYVPAVSNALEVFHSLKGDCGEHQVLFVALARAAGIPARAVVGMTYWPPGNGFGYHAWAEVYVGQWIAVDPTQHAMNADATHIQLAGGDLAEQARITALIGKMKAQIEKAM